MKMFDPIPKVKMNTKIDQEITSTDNLSFDQAKDVSEKDIG